MTEIDLDDAAAVEAADRQGVLPAVASAAAQVRAAATATAEADVTRLIAAGRPRAVVCVGMGGSGIAGDVLAAVAGTECPIPVWVHRDGGLPAWVGVPDVVLACSATGETDETLSATDEAIRRGADLMCVTAADSSLARRAQQARAAFVPVPDISPPQAGLWALAVPGLVVAEQWGLLHERLDLEATAVRLEQVAAACYLGRDSLVNPAKGLALALGGRIPQVWGSSPLTGVAAYRFACQLNAQARTVAAYGVLPEVAHHQLAVLDGPAAGSPDDIFADPDLDGPAALRLAQVLLRDPAGESGRVRARADAVVTRAEERGTRLLVIDTQGATRLERLASVVGVTDFAAAFLGLQAVMPS